VAAWIRLDMLTRRVIGRRVEHGATPETDEALDKLMVLRAWTGRLVTDVANVSQRRPHPVEGLHEAVNGQRLLCSAPGSLDTRLWR
jgi:hypothetical protein